MTTTVPNIHVYIDSDTIFVWYLINIETRDTYVVDI